jgi:hypothetical protein
MDLKEILREDNAKIKETTLNLYVRTLEKLKRDCDGDSMYKFLKNPKKVFECLGSNHNTIKTKIVPILILLRILDADKDILDAYRDAQMESVNAVNEMYKSGEKTQKQKDNWLTKDELEAIQAEEEKEYEQVLEKKRGILKPHGYLDLQNFILLSLYMKFPLRNDVHNMKVVLKSKWNKMSNIRKNEGNYLVINKTDAFLILNDYKTANTYGQKKIELGEDLTDLINNFLKFREKHGWGHEYFIINKKGEPMAANGITKSFNRLFDKYNKRISTSMIRHIILTEMFGDVEKQKEEMADKIGNSAETITNKYIKK